MEPQDIYFHNPFLFQVLGSYQCWWILLWNLEAFHHFWLHDSKLHNSSIHCVKKWTHGIISMRMKCHRCHSFMKNNFWCIYWICQHLYVIWVFLVLVGFLPLQNEAGLYLLGGFPSSIYWGYLAASSLMGHPEGGYICHNLNQVCIPQDYHSPYQFQVMWFPQTYQVDYRLLYHFSRHK